MTALSGAERQRRYRDRTNRGPGPRPRWDDLEVLCWCRDQIVHVPPSEVQALLTRSCGSAACDQADRKARA